MTVKSAYRGKGSTQRESIPKSRELDDSVRIFIVAEVRLYREGLADVLQREESFRVVGATPFGPETTEAIGRASPDVVLLDMQIRDSLRLIRTISEAARGAGVIALAVPEVDRYLLNCVEAGAAGYVTQDQSIEDVTAAVRSAACGEAVVSPRMAARLLRHVSALAAGVSPSEPLARLTPRERDIAARVERGLSNKQIARELSIEVATVKNHVHNILEKLHVNRRSEAAARLRAYDFAHSTNLEEGLPEL
jgi:DNA-binding NarL/FixJ family response regulator